MDDCLFFTRNRLYINKLLDLFKTDRDRFNWEMAIGGFVEKNLSLNVKRIQEGNKFCCKFSQSGLINNILESTSMIKYNGKPTLHQVIFH